MPVPKKTALALIVVATGCGGGSPPPAVTAPVPPAAAVVAAPAPVASATPATAVPEALPASDDDDPEESATPIPLTPEITRPWDKASFPKKTTDEGRRWQTINVSGNEQKDFDALVGSCGTPAGLREYAKPAHGHLHSVKDKRDTFTIQLFKGLCYRYFAVGDSGIKDIDILVEKKGGVLVGDDKQTGPVAIIDASKTWCMTKDDEYLFNVEVDGEGKGRYVFGVWARPQ